MAEQNQGKQVQIKATDEVLKGVYSNAIQVTHNQEEFVLDYMNIYPWQGLGMLNARVIVSPAHMKRMIAALNDNVKKYEDRFGKIPMSQKTYDDAIGFQTE